MSVIENVAPALARALSDRGYARLTAVQEAILDPGLAAEDLIVSAQTGSGKTVAFGIALAPQLLAGAEAFGKAEAPLALVIAPTRELAMQVKTELAWLYEPAGAQIASCVGGMDQREEQRSLWRGAHIVVGTPGRLSDHIRRGSLELGGIRAVVLDEADEMLKLGFREELEFILEAAPPTRRTLMFSATMPKAIEALARAYQRNAQRVNTAGEAQQHGDIDYRAMVVASQEAENAIFNVLRYYDAPNALVFCSTRAAVTRMMSRFANRGFAAVALSGELSQGQRTHAIQALRDRRAQVCVATDVAARGLDLPDLELVIHAELPKSAEVLLHRSGRTGRAGRKGTSVIIVPHKARRSADRLLKSASIMAKWVEPPSAEDVRRRDDERLLADPVLFEPIREDERAFAQTLLEAYEPDQLAAAFIRLHRAGKASGEDLTPAPDAIAQEGPPPRFGARDANPVRRERIVTDGPRKAPKNNFENGVWISLGVGRLQYAEPRWIIPVLCDAGDITKREIGAIRIEDNDTFMELDPNSADAFLSTIASKGQLERSLVVKRLAQEPRQAARSRAPEAAASVPHSEAPRTVPAAPASRSGDSSRTGERLKRPDKRSNADRPRPERPKADRPTADRPFEDRVHEDRSRAPAAEIAPPTESRKARRARQFGHAGATPAAGDAPPPPAKTADARPPGASKPRTAAAESSDARPPRSAKPSTPWEARAKPKGGPGAPHNPGEGKKSAFKGGAGKGGPGKGNFGQGNFGEGKSGQGNFGKGNFGQGNFGKGGGGKGGVGAGQGGFGKSYAGKGPGKARGGGKGRGGPG